MNLLSLLNFFPQFSMDSDPVVVLNVGGKLFHTRRSTLVPRSAYFTAMFAGGFKPPSQETPELINRCPKLFRHVLRLLLDSRYDFPPRHRNELDFFQIEYLDEPAPPPLEFGWSHFRLCVGETHVQIGYATLEIEKLAAVVVLFFPGNPPSTELELVSPDNTHHRLYANCTAEELAAALRLFFAALNLEARETTSKDDWQPTRGTSVAFYIPAHTHPIGFGPSGFRLFDGRFFEDAPFYTEWCLRQRRPSLV